MIVWHDLVVELHTGVVVFVFIAIAMRVFVDLGQRGKTNPLATVRELRQGTDFVAYSGAVVAVVFLIVSGITGYLLESYSNLVTEPILLNKEFAALGALFFWTAFAFLRFWSGRAMWEKKELYAIALVTALFGVVFHDGRGLDRSAALDRPVRNGSSLQSALDQLQAADTAANRRRDNGRNPRRSNHRGRVPQAVAKEQDGQSLRACLWTRTCPRTGTSIRLHI